MINYFKAFKEIIFSSLNLMFWLVDSFLYAMSLIDPSIQLDKSIYIAVLILGFLISATKIVVQKNEALTKEREIIPQVGLYLKRDQERAGKKVDIFRLRNLWSEPIKNIKIVPIKMYFSKLSFKLDGTNILRQDEERDLLRYTKSQITRNLIFPAAFDPNYAVADFKMKIYFSDARDRRYKVIYNLGKSGIFIKSQKRIESRRRKK